MAETIEKNVQTTVEKKEPKEGFLGRKTFFPFFSMTPHDFFTFNPFEMMKKFSDEMDKAFTGYGFLRNFETEPTFWIPTIEVFEKEGKFFVRAELPGLKKEDVKVELVENALIIKGERKQEKEEKTEGFYRSEMQYGKFYRNIPLPEYADMEAIEAKFTNGVLEVVIPIPETVRKRREIPVEEVKVQQAQAATKG
jgi:HSP20 family protein